MKKAVRQAIVVIHGIGEQKPMGTLRGFIKSILAKENPNSYQKRDYWSKPDTMSQSFELRKMVASSTPERATVHFFEYYWAYHMRQTTFNHVIPWFSTLLLVRPSRVPKRLRFAWCLSWLLLVLAICFVAFGFIDYFELLKINFPIPVSVIGFLASALAQKALIYYIGDAARYLTPDPENIKERHNIRTEGINLLRALHESGEYERIIIVGHSLGSVIGYDIINHLWPEFNNELENPDPDQSPEQPANKKMEDLLNDPTAFDLGTFRQQQSELLNEQKKFNNRWLITDFITLGSPLAHAHYLLTRSSKDLQEQFDERNLPTCPPALEDDKISYVNYYEKHDDKKRGVAYLHHAAPFAVTRWTNLYFPGDLVGGPIAPLFGPGVEDKKVRFNHSTFLSYLPTSHTQYWKDTIEGRLDESRYNDVVKALYDALQLDELQRNRPI